MQRCTRIHSVIRHLTSRTASERGQVLVEFAIVLPVLMAIIMGIVYFGRYEDYNNQLTQLAEEGARWSAVDYTPASGTLQNYILAQAQPELANGSSDVTKAVAYVYLPSGSSYATGQPIRVCVVSTVTYPALVTSMTSRLVQAATMRIEQVNTVSGVPSNPYTSGNPSGATTPPVSTGCPTS